MDSYTKIANLYPTLVALLIPAIITGIFCYYAIPDFLESFSGVWGYIKFFFPFLVVYAVTYWLMDLFRIVSKVMYQNPVFGQNELKMPTTRLLLPSANYFTEDTRNQIIEKIRQDFVINIPPYTAENDLEYRRKTVEAVRKIRNKVRGDVIVDESNRRYGFCRNLVGGLTIGILYSIILIACSRLMDFPTEKMFILTILELVLLAFSLLMAWYNAGEYARKMYDRYLLI